ncbi:hypothetical protein K435DRAFT_851084 [Dendrothele bispora CBS 962.96]|uniref:Uncharacterized protein n=1 Tax=Dendrothele bispora (strain CBS 962.96) TaxID=1314807 RepID=A0A4S8MMV4_DENBC|nr:hypothetical protein K435DRAFT_851084 [Dendrothele bispora CBS 962.96]
MGFFLYLDGGLQARFGDWGVVDNANVWVIEGHDSATKGIIVCSYLFVCSFAVTMGPVSWTYPAEIVSFPSSLSLYIFRSRTNPSSPLFRLPGLPSPSTRPQYPLKIRGKAVSLATVSKMDLTSLSHGPSHPVLNTSLGKPTSSSSSPDPDQNKITLHPFIYSNTHSSNNNGSNELSQQECKSWYEHCVMITSIIAWVRVFASIGQSLPFDNDIAGWENGIRKSKLQRPQRNLEMYFQVFADAASATAIVPTSIPVPISPTGTIEQPLFNLSSSQIHDNTSSPTPQSSEIFLSYNIASWEDGTCKYGFTVSVVLVESGLYQVSVVPSSRWASSSPSSSTSPPYHSPPLTSASSPSTLDLFFSALQQRHLLASSIINFEFATGCSDCKRELGYRIQRAERD